MSRKVVTVEFHVELDEWETNEDAAAEVESQLDVAKSHILNWCEYPILNFEITGVKRYIKREVG